MGKQKLLLNDLREAVERFKEALKLSADNDVIRAGCIQYFEFCFELTWKTIKSVAQDQGLDNCNSPKAALKLAFASGWIRDELIWLDMLTSRNRMSHTYNAVDALKVYNQLSSYLPALESLIENLERQ